uniref:hypothetical protein n=1 Tax=Allorhizocola rhizosphaerae TaxID=1872709 RepID=UPI001B8D33E0
MTTSAVKSRSGRVTGENGRRADEAAGTGSEAVEEVTGEVSGVSESGGPQEAHAEVGTEAAESGEEFAEAAPEALAQVEGEESATGDLRAEGYEPPEAAEENETAEALGVIPEAGTALGGGQEFLPVLAGLAAKVAPLLASAAGPGLARAVQGRLSPRAQRVLAKP